MILIVSVTGGTYNMNITTRITKLDNPESKLKALATVVLNGNFAVGGIKVIGTEKGMYVAMPNHLGKDNQYYDDCYPVTAEMRKAINTAVMTAYENNDTAVIKSEPEAIAMKVKVLPNNNHDSNLKGFAQITMDDCFVVSGVKVFDGANGMFCRCRSIKIPPANTRILLTRLPKNFMMS